MVVGTPYTGRQNDRFQAEKRAGRRGADRKVGVGETRQRRSLLRECHLRHRRRHPQKRKVEKKIRRRSEEKVFLLAPPKKGGLSRLFKWGEGFSLSLRGGELNQVATPETIRPRNKRSNGTL